MEHRKMMLVIDSDPHYARALARYAVDSDSFYDSAFAADGAEGLRLIRALSPDVIILDSVLPSLDGIGVLRRIAENASEKPVIIMLMHAQPAKMFEAAARYGVDYFMIKPQSCRSICDAARDLLTGSAAPGEEKDTGLEKSIAAYLRGLGMPAHLNGYRYMRSALMLTVDDPAVISPITKSLYPAIAKMFRTSKSCVERALRHAIAVSWQRGSRKLLSDIFGYNYDDTPYRPTNSEFIAMISDDFRMKYKYDML